MTTVNYQELGTILVRDFSMPRRKWIAELTSSSSDNSIKFFDVKTTGAFEVIASLFAISYVTDERDGFARRNYVEKISREGQRYNWEGTWKIVKEIISNNILVPYTVIDVILRHYSTHTLFGNIIPLARRLMNSLRIYNPYEAPKSKPRKTQRKRGYDDKGSLRPPHQWQERHFFEGPNPEKETIEISYVPHSAGWLGNLYSRRNQLWEDIPQNSNKSK